MRILLIKKLLNSFVIAGLYCILGGFINNDIKKNSSINRLFQNQVSQPLFQNKSPSAVPLSQSVSKKNIKREKNKTNRFLL